MKKACSIKDCDRVRYAHGLCEKHYQRVKKHDCPDDRRGHHLPLHTKFWFWAEKTDGCWLWLGKTYKGYGRIWHQGKTLRAHRASWLIHYGEIPESLYVCHNCDNPTCVNPQHLFLGTHQDNMDDKVKKDRCAHSDRKGEKAGKAKLTNEKVIAIRADSRNQEVIAAEYGVDPSTISDIQRRKTWKHI